MQQSAAQSEEDANEESRSGGRRLVWKARDGTTCVAVFANHGEKEYLPHDQDRAHIQGSGFRRVQVIEQFSRFGRLQNIPPRWVPATPRRSSSTRAKASLAADLPIIPIWSNGAASVAPFLFQSFMSSCPFSLRPQAPDAPRPGMLSGSNRRATGAASFKSGETGSVSVNASPRDMYLDAV
jgi:hypothetical protein